MSSYEKTSVYSQLVFTRAELYATGASRSELRDAVAAGKLFHPRRDRYVLSSAPPEIVEAARLGAQVCCVTLLAMLGVFALDTAQLHMYQTPGKSRIRRFSKERVHMHWNSLAFGLESRHAVAIGDAVMQSISCQPPRAAIATLDSLLHLGLMTHSALVDLFHELPAKYATILSLVDPSAESGPETFMRLILRGLGLRFETQVEINGVGRVDFVVEGWLIIECDSRTFHEGWEQQCRDRSRDIAAAAQGYVTIRPIASDLFNRPGLVRQQVTDVVRAFEQRRSAA